MTESEKNVYRKLMARYFATRPDKIEILSIEKDSLGRQLVELKYKGYPYRVVCKNGIAIESYRIVS